MSAVPRSFGARTRGGQQRSILTLVKSQKKNFSAVPPPTKRKKSFRWLTGKLHARAYRLSPLCTPRRCHALLPLDAGLPSQSCSLAWCEQPRSRRWWLYVGAGLLWGWSRRCVRWLAGACGDRFLDRKIGKNEAQKKRSRRSVTSPHAALRIV